MTASARDLGSALASCTIWLFNSHSVFGPSLDTTAHPQAISSKGKRDRFVSERTNATSQLRYKAPNSERGRIPGKMARKGKSRDRRENPTNTNSTSGIF